jgi:thiopeptide-type bacteriocin biosynthesis protein
MNGWVSLHVYYNKDPRPLLTDCIAPLIARLRAEELLARYFFIRYFEGGLHVRLRLLPVDPGSVAPLKALAEAAIGRFLERRPCLISLPGTHMPSTFSRWFEFEYGADTLREAYGSEGLIPYRPNNSLHYIDYRPEEDRYGGAGGVALAEEHFEASSDVALACLRETNSHVRTILLGQAMQLMQLSLLVLVTDEAAMCEFLSRYEAYWMRGYRIFEPDGLPRFEQNYQALAAGLAERYRSARTALSDGHTFSTSTQTRWAGEVTRLKGRLLEAWEARRLVVPAQIDTFPALVSHLLSSYLHMTNNRLGLQIVEEAYLAYLLRRTIEEGSSAGGGKAHAAVG